MTMIFLKTGWTFLRSALPALRRLGLAAFFMSCTPQQSAPEQSNNLESTDGAQRGRWVVGDPSFETAPTPRPTLWWSTIKAVQ